MARFYVAYAYAQGFGSIFINDTENSEVNEAFLKAAPATIAEHLHEPFATYIVLNAIKVADLPEEEE
jgi:hypothetical protein